FGDGHCRPARGSACDRTRPAADGRRAQPPRRIGRLRSTLDPRRGAIRNWIVLGRAPDCAPDRRSRVGENEPLTGRTRAFAVLSAVLVLVMVGYVGVAIVRACNAASRHASAANTPLADPAPT